MGDRFENISGSIVINRSVLNKSLNQVRDDGDDIAGALQQLAHEVERSGNPEAIENLNAFNDELQKPEPRKSVLKNLFNGITTALPLLTNMTDLIERVSRLFS